MMTKKCLVVFEIIILGLFVIITCNKSVKPVDNNSSTIQPESPSPVKNDQKDQQTPPVSNHEDLHQDSASVTTDNSILVGYWVSKLNDEGIRIEKNNGINKVIIEFNKLKDNAPEIDKNIPIAKAHIQDDGKSGTLDFILPEDQAINTPLNNIPFKINYDKSSKKVVVSSSAIPIGNLAVSLSFTGKLSENNEKITGELDGLPDSTIDFIKLALQQDEVVATLEEARDDVDNNAHFDIKGEWIGEIPDAEIVRDSNEIQNIIMQNKIEVPLNDKNYFKFDIKQDSQNNSICDWYIHIKDDTVLQPLIMNGPITINTDRINFVGDQNNSFDCNVTNSKLVCKFTLHQQIIKTL